MVTEVIGSCVLMVPPTIIRLGLQLMGSGSLQFIRNLIAKVDTNQQMMLKLIATVEITLMPTSVFMILL